MSLSKGRQFLSVENEYHYLWKMIELPVLYEDRYLMVVNKPQGMMVEEIQPGADSVMAVLKKQFKAALRGNNILQNVHRLDKPVSGALLIARKASAVKILSKQFANKEISKKYLAIVSGQPATPKAELTNWLTKDDANKKAIIKDRKSQHALEVKLRYAVMATHEGRSLLDIELITGKYHQIRAQLAYLGHPIVGDEKYGSTESYMPDAIALHAASLTFRHPIDDTLMAITAPVPDDELWASFQP